MNVINHCEEVFETLPALKADPGFIFQYAAKKGELADLARNQVCPPNPSNAFYDLISFS
jgi:hypothetical protein